MRITGKIGVKMTETRLIPGLELDIIKEAVQECLYAREKGVEAKLAFAAGIKKLFDACETVSGGSSFSKICKDVLGIDNQRASEWLSISSIEASRNSGKLPTSTSALLAIAKAQEKGIDDLKLSEKTTVKDIKKQLEDKRIEVEAIARIQEKVEADVGPVNPITIPKAVVRDVKSTIREEERQEGADDDDAAYHKRLGNYAHTLACFARNQLTPGATLNRRQLQVFSEMEALYESYSQCRAHLTPEHHGIMAAHRHRLDRFMEELELDDELASVGGYQQTTIFGK